ncbi:unnamed protein product [Rotaria socialis]|uniref:O-methyltransferase C-terminal domain-containing protein n=1 Tax=Rotaria socialis TaxID=392032 RepID=A0A817TEN1_9BILA|nr:unnamed protein product [Rotaria socialis]
MSKSVRLEEHLNLRLALVTYITNANSTLRYFTFALFPLTILQENIYLLKFILHNYDDEKVPSICGVDKTRNQHPPNIFIIACVISPDGDISKWQAHAMDWATATLFNKGQERTLDEYQRLRKQAGFDYQQFYPPQVPPEVQNLPVCAYGRVGKILQT